MATFTAKELAAKTKGAAPNSYASGDLVFQGGKEKNKKKSSSSTPTTKNPAPNSYASGDLEFQGSTKENTSTSQGAVTLKNPTPPGASEKVLVPLKEPVTQEAAQQRKLQELQRQYTEFNQQTEGLTAGDILRQYDIKTRKTPTGAEAYLEKKPVQNLQTFYSEITKEPVNKGPYKLGNKTVVIVTTPQPDKVKRAEYSPGGLLKIPQTPEGKFPFQYRIGRSVQRFYSEKVRKPAVEGIINYDAKINKAYEERGIKEPLDIRIVRGVTKGAAFEVVDPINIAKLFFYGTGTGAAVQYGVQYGARAVAPAVTALKTIKGGSAAIKGIILGLEAGSVLALGALTTEQIITNPRPAEASGRFLVQAGAFGAGFSAGRAFVAQPKVIPSIDAWRQLASLNDPRRINLNPSTLETRGGKVYVEVARVNGKPVYSNFVDYTKPTPKSPLGLPESYYKGLTSQNKGLLDENLASYGRTIGPKTKPFNTGKFDVYDRVTGITYKNLPEDSLLLKQILKQIAASAEREGLPRLQVIGYTRAGAPIQANTQTFFNIQGRQTRLSEFITKPAEAVKYDLIVTQTPKGGFSVKLNKKGQISTLPNFELGTSRQIKSTSLATSPIGEPGAQLANSLYKVQPIAGLGASLFLNKPKTDPRLPAGLKEVTEEKAQILELTRPSYRAVYKSVAETNLGEASKQAQKEDELTKTLTLTKTKSRTKEALKLEQVQEQKQEPILELVQETVIQPPRTTFQNTITETPFTTRTPKPFLPLAKSTEIKKRGPAGFVAINRKGFRISPVLPRAQAVAYGELVADTSATQSFKVVQVDEPVINLSYTLKKIGYKFRKGTKGFIVEKRKNAIDTPGELREITSKGLAALKLKNSKGGVFGSTSKIKSVFGRRLI